MEYYKKVIEYLLEFSMQNSIYSSIPFIWSSYRANAFLKNKYNYHLLSSCIEKMINNSYEDRDSDLLSSLELLSTFESIRYTSMVRSEKINRVLDDIEISNKILEVHSYSEMVNIEKTGREAILDYLEGLNIECINERVVLFLNSCRMILKDSQSINRTTMHKFINHTLESENYA